MGITYFHAPYEFYVQTDKVFNKVHLRIFKGGKDASGEPGDHFSFSEKWLGILVVGFLLSALEGIIKSILE